MWVNFATVRKFWPELANIPSLHRILVGNSENVAKIKKNVCLGGHRELRTQYQHQVPVPSSPILALHHKAQAIDKVRLSEQVKKIASIGLFAMQKIDFTSEGMYN